MKKNEYLRLWRQIQSESDDRIKALNTVWAMANPGEPLPDPNATEPKGGRVAFSAEILAIVKGLPQEFSVRDVEEAIASQPNAPKMDRSTVSHTLKRAAASGMLKVVEVGQGKRPTRYLRPAADGTQAAGPTAPRPIFMRRPTFTAAPPRFSSGRPASIPPAPPMPPPPGSQGGAK